MCRELVPMLMETMPVKPRRRTPWPIAMTRFIRPYDRSLGLLKQKIKKSGLGDPRKKSEPQENHTAAPEANNSHHKIHKTRKLRQVI